LQAATATNNDHLEPFQGIHDGDVASHHLIGPDGPRSSSINSDVRSHSFSLRSRPHVHGNRSSNEGKMKNERSKSRHEKLDIQLTTNYPFMNYRTEGSGNWKGYFFGRFFHFSFFLAMLMR
jgi:hypothetical protein